MTTRKELTGMYEDQLQKLTIIKNFLALESNELDSNELQRIEQMLLTNGKEVKGLMSVVNGKERRARDAETDRAALLWQAFLTAASHQPMQALMDVYVEDAGVDGLDSMNEFSVVITFGERSQRAKCTYKLTKEEYLNLLEACQITDHGDWEFKHGSAATAVEGLIPTRILPDGIVVPDILKQWNSISV